jgi:hypothetical protein
MIQHHTERAGRTDMPIQHTIDVERRLVHSRLWDVVTELDAWSSAASLMDDPSFDPTFVQLSDMRAVTKIEVSPGTIRDLAVMRIFDATARRALVVGSDLQTGVGRMTTSYAERGDQQIALFTSLTEAERWLGVAES